MGSIPQKLARTTEIKISAKTSKIAILRERLVFKNFDLLQRNGSNSVIFGRIHLIFLHMDTDRPFYVLGEGNWN